MAGRKNARRLIYSANYRRALNKIADTLLLDKKSSGKAINFVFVTKCGATKIVKIAASELNEHIKNII